MAFLSQFGNLPTIQTRKALLLLDFQNDFVRSSGALPVPNTAEFLDALPQAAAAFRRNGDVVWVRSLYDAPRPLTSSDAQELIVLDCPTDKRKKRVSDPGAPPTGPVDEEAFLSSSPPQCCRPQTAGLQFPAPILTAIKTDEDTLIDKSDYSALQDQGLILSFRTRFVTELYLCGSLSNVSVYATALDAVRLGFSVTLIEDCLGHRSFARHEEAMRRMADIFGASGITTEELYEELDWQETDAIARKGGPRPVRSVNPAGIEGVMGGLDMKPERRTATKAERAEASQEGNQRRNLEEILADYPDDEDGDMLELAALTRAHNRYMPSGPRDSQPAEEKRIHTKVRRARRQDKKPNSASRPTHRRGTKSNRSVHEFCRPGDRIGEGDSRIVYELDLPPEAFEQIRDEVVWQKMYHLSGEVPRLVAVQGRPQPDGSIPIYRHPADESPPLRPFTSTVDQVRAIVERILAHPLNHVLIQLYRDGQDRISEHSDKSLDIVRGSSICNVSLGCQRTMVLRSKATHESEDGEPGRLTQRIPMPHESLFVLGEKTNMRWLHGIRPDKRPDSEKSMDEKAYDGQRISLTFRHIGTFLDPAGDTIWGQGAVSKTQAQAKPVIHGVPAQTDRLIRAFGEENHSTELDWNAVYEGGFDVVNFVTTSTAKLALSRDPVANLRVQLGLNESGIRYDVVHPTDQVASEKPAFTADDGSVVTGDVQILTYLTQEALGRPSVSHMRGGDQLGEIDELLSSWRECQENGKKTDFSELEDWEDSLDGQPYLCGPVFGIDDCSLWPVLRDIIQNSRFLSPKVYRNLTQYYDRVEKRVIVKKTLEEIR